MAYDENLAARIRQRLARRKNIEEKKMFGGIGFLLNGNLLVGVRKESLLVPVAARSVVRFFRVTGGMRLGPARTPMENITQRQPTLRAQPRGEPNSVLGKRI
jgi:hypothetical protein